MELGVVPSMGRSRKSFEALVSSGGSAAGGGLAGSGGASGGVGGGGKAAAPIGRSERLARRNSEKNLMQSARLGE